MLCHFVEIPYLQRLQGQGGKFEKQAADAGAVRESGRAAYTAPACWIVGSGQEAAGSPGWHKAQAGGETYKPLEAAHGAVCLRMRCCR